MTSVFLAYIGSALIGYLAGSVPVGLLITRFVGAGDLRQTGSGNIGATNVLRAAGRIPALITVILDAGKAGFIYLALVAIAGETYGLTGGMAAVLGHCFPIWLGFRGGKGIAASAGLLVAISWPVLLCLFGAWLILVIATSYASVASIVAAMLAPVLAWGFGASAVQIAFVGALSVLAILRHIPNIMDLLRGTERKTSLWKRR